MIVALSRRFLLRPAQTAIHRVAIEEYSDYGAFHDILPVHDQFHEVWAVFDLPNGFLDIEAGVGVGVTSGADRLTFKLMLSRDLKPKN